MSQALWEQIAGRAVTPLNDAQVGQLSRYLDLLIEWNGKLNLTRIVDRADAEVRHVADALTLLAHLPRAAATDEAHAVSLVDVGTGGGVPGVILAIARPDLRVTLIDSTKKKLDAVAAIAQSLDLSNVRTLNARIESVKERFDVVTARAVAELSTLLEWCAPLMHPRSVLLAMKGPKASEEIEAIPMRVRKQFQIDVLPVEVPELRGHVTARVRFANGR